MGGCFTGSLNIGFNKCRLKYHFLIGYLSFHFSNHPDYSVNGPTPKCTGPTLNYAPSPPPDILMFISILNDNNW